MICWNSSKAYDNYSNRIDGKFLHDEEEKDYLSDQ